MTLYQERRWNVQVIVLQLSIFLGFDFVVPREIAVVPAKFHNNVRKQFEHEGNNIADITDQCFLCTHNVGHIRGWTVLDEIESKNITHLYKGGVSRRVVWK